MLTEVDNSRRCKEYEVIDKVTAATLKELGHTIFPILINFLTKRIKDSTPQYECMDG